MLLVIPSVEIQNGRCVCQVEGTRGFKYSDDPVEMAKLWRKENAKSIHVTDLDGIASGKPMNLDLVERMVKTVDIPIELGGGLQTFDDLKNALATGIYRAVIGSMLIDNPDEAKLCLEKFGSSKIILGINANDYIEQNKIDVKNKTVSPVLTALKAKELGFRRIVYRDIVTEGLNRKPNIENIQSFAQKIQLKITVSGGISGLDDLLALQKLEPLGVDSVIIGRALYQNKFSCQLLWRLCEYGDYPYTAKV